VARHIFQACPVWMSITYLDAGLSV
jgi:hypothetical protein